MKGSVGAQASDGVVYGRLRRLAVGSRPSVQRHPELPPWRQQELTPIALIMQALSEAPEGAFAEACGGALREADSCPPEW
jgi:hypothetical protein